MKLKVWQSFSSNNSSAYRLVARFSDAESARQMGDDLQILFDKHEAERLRAEPGEYDPEPTQAQRDFGDKYGFTWRGSFLYGGAFNDEEQPQLTVIEDKLLIFHSYCSGFEELSEFLPYYADEIEDHSSDYPTITVIVKLSESNTNPEQLQELETYFKKSPEHPPERRRRALILEDHNGIHYFSDGRTAIVIKYTDPDEISAIKNHLQNLELDNFRLILCDESITNKLRTLKILNSCPQCRSPDWQYLDSELENLQEAHVLCNSCGGMFALEELSKLASIEEIGSETLFSIHGRRGKLFVVGKGGYIYASIYGNPLTQKYKAEHDLYAVSVLDKEQIMVAGAHGILLYSNDSGENWERRTTPVEESLFQICQAQNGELYILGKMHLLFSNNGGDSWTTCDIPTKEPLYIFALSSDILFLLGKKGGIYKSLNGGQTWEEQKSNVSADLHSMFMFSKQEGIIVGKDSTILKTEDGGQNWSRQSAGDVGDLTALATGDEGRLYALGSFGHVISSRDRGENWKTRRVDYEGKLHHIWSSRGGHLLLAGEDGLLVRYLEFAFMGQSE